MFADETIENILYKLLLFNASLRAKELRFDLPEMARDDLRGCSAVGAEGTM